MLTEPTAMLTDMGMQDIYGGVRCLEWNPDVGDALLTLTHWTELSWKGFNTICRFIGLNLWPSIVL